MEPSLETIHQWPIAQVYEALHSRPEGLTHAEAEERLRRYGHNVLAEVRRTPLILRFLANFTHMMAILLWIGGIVAFVAQMPQLGIAIWAVNIINGCFGFWQEFRAEKATEALKRLLPVQARVLREGLEERISAEDLVPGDVILLGEGDRVSADARLVEDAELAVDQSTFTGEAHPVYKLSEAVLNPAIQGADRPNLVFAGTTVVSGTGKAVVYATGMNTSFGQVAHLTQSLKDEPSPLQKEMKVVTRNVTLIAVLVGIVFFIISITLAGMRLAEAFIFGMGMIVAFVPEGLLPTVTLSLALGVQRMAKRHALIKRLSAVETLGCTTVICTDKTGTLTQNEMTVTDIWFNGHTLRVTGTGYTPEGQILDGDRPITVQDDPDLERLLLGASLCNDARLLPPNGESNRWTILGDPTEAALKVVAMKAGLDINRVSAQCPRVRALPFESRRKRMTTIHHIVAPGGMEQWAYVKGAPREVLDLCTHRWNHGQEIPLDEEERARIVAANDRFARNGLRVLAVAMRRMPFDRTARPTMAYTPETVERDLTFLGLIAMMDPPRPEVLAAVEKCHRAGIRIIMITGDYGLTAESIARRIGIIRGDQPRILTGRELDAMSDAELTEALQGEVIFARVAPEHKLRVVERLQAMGHIVAVTGDGVNDAPALKKADIGVAMGLTGTDVAKEAADMILTNDNFASIVDAIEEGRAVYANIKKFTTYIFTSNTPEAVPFILFALSGTRIPLALNVMHILSVDLGTDMVPALALGAEPPEPGVMDRPPRKITEHVITRSMLLRAYLWLGLWQSLAVMVSFYWMFWSNGYWGQWLDLPSEGPLYRAATGMALATVVATQIGNVFAQRSERISAFRLPLFNNRLLWLGIVSEITLIILITYAPFLQTFIGTAAFSPRYWLFIFMWTPILLLADELRKLVVNGLERFKTQRLARRQAV